MNPEYQEMTLGEFVTLQRGHDLPTHSRNKGTVPIMGSFGITGYHDCCKANGPGVTVGRSGASYGVVCFVNQDYWPLNTALYVVDFHGNDERFAYYFLKSKDFKRFNSGSAQPSLNRNFIHPIPVRIPPLPEQKRIARILGTLDDKIELNRRMNETLEAAARALFKSWFVDFDPVRYKLAGKDPCAPVADGGLGLDAQTAALFPDKLVPSPLGMIPEGWEVKPLAHYCKIAIGGDWGKEEEFPESVAVRCIRGTDIGKLTQTGYSNPPTRWIKTTSLNKRKISNTDIIIAASGLGPLGKTLYMHSEIPSLWSEPITYSNFCKRLVCASSERAIYSERILRNLHQTGEVWDYAIGTSIPNLDLKGLLQHFDVIIPPDLLLGRFAEIQNNFYAKKYSNENITLASTRDALLPRLISGEIELGRTK